MPKKPALQVLLTTFLQFLSIKKISFHESSSQKAGQIVPRSLLIRLLTPARRTAMPSTSGSAARPRLPVFRLDNTIYGIYRRWRSHCIRLDENCGTLRLSSGHVLARGTSIFAYEGADRVSPSTCCCWSCCWQRGREIVVPEINWRS